MSKDDFDSNNLDSDKSHDTDFKLISAEYDEIQGTRGLERMYIRDLERRYL